MHVFVDTNILLNFFHYSKDELEALNNIFASHEHGSAKVHLTEQVCDEFKRNRETKIKDALKKFSGTTFTPQFPSFLKGYEEYSEIRKLGNELQNLQKAILAKVKKDVSDQNLIADRLIKQIFTTSEIVPLSITLFERASMRMALGNPPGKNKSLGDAVNWLILLESVPDGEDLHIISEDGDFYSALDEKGAHPFLAEEWATKKRGNLRIYRQLSAFMSEHFDGIAFSFDKKKEALIDELSEAGSFSATHQLVAKLENFSYFSLKEVTRILDAADENGQFGAIITDSDISDFINRIVGPYLSGLLMGEHRDRLQMVIQEQNERDQEDS